MEIFIGALIVAGVAWIFVRHYGRKSTDTGDASQAPYKVETPAAPAPQDPPAVEQKPEPAPAVDGRWPFPTSGAPAEPAGAENRVEATAPVPASKARVKNTVKAPKEPKAVKATPKVVKTVKEPKMAKEAKPKAPKAGKDTPTLTVVDNKPKRGKK